jgi:hypothetical protein
MKLSFGALRTRRRLRIRVPASPPSFVNALQTGTFGTWVHFRKVRRQTLLPTGLGPLSVGVSDPSLALISGFQLDFRRVALYFNRRAKGL